MAWLSNQPLPPPWPPEIPNFTPVSGGGDAPSHAVQANRHNSPDLTAQLRQAQTQSVHTIICSMLDADPRLRLNAVAAAVWGDLLAKGIQEIARQIGAKRIWLIIEEHTPPAWISTLRPIDGEIIELPNHYPQADPTVLLYTLTRSHLRPGRLPPDAGVLLLDAPAAIAVGRGQMQTVPIGLLDHATARAAYLEVPTGLSLDAALQAAGLSKEGKSLFAGDHLRGNRIAWTDPAGPGELIFHLVSDLAPRMAQPCIRCGWCLEVCPTHVSPALVLEAAQRDDPVLARAAGINACIQCGLCDQVCPSDLPLRMAIRRFKLDV